MNKFEKLKKEQEKRKRLRQSKRFLRVAAFLHQKKLLVVPDMKQTFPKERIKVVDVLWAAKIEPRILEVFPAALIHFERKFTGKDKLPRELLFMIDKIKRNETYDGEFRGIKYKDMLRWANIKLNDGRTVPVKEKKRQHNFRFSKDVVSKMEKLMQARGESATTLLESLILRA